VAGTVGAWSSGVAGQPAAIARPAGVVRPAVPVQAGPGLSSPTSQSARLDALFATASKPASNPAMIAQGMAGRQVRKVLTARQIARRLLHRFHWSKRQFRYLDPLWARESSWNVYAENPYSGAYGIPQAVPGSKMASAGRHWRSCARTQILWGLRYIKDQYGSPAAAWAHELATGWY
jgi:resuscitation-promoting factor RpfB